MQPEATWGRTSREGDGRGGSPSGPPSEAAKQGFKSRTARNFRHNLAVRTRRRPDDAEAHHIFPKKFEQPTGWRSSGPSSPVPTAWSAYYLALVSDTYDVRAALTHLEAPEHLTAPLGRGEGVELAAFLRWADPDLPDHWPTLRNGATVRRRCGRSCRLGPIGPEGSLQVPNPRISAVIRRHLASGVRITMARICRGFVIRVAETACP